MDFFLQNRCRTAADIRRSPLRPYGVLVKDRGTEETKLSLPEDVYVSYLDQAEHTKGLPTAVSRQKRCIGRKSGNGCSDSPP